MKITYFVNQYPKVSHTFIRREIIELENKGFSVQRVSLRGWDAEVADCIDVEEQKKTQYVLSSGILPLIVSALFLMCSRPILFFSALKLALSQSYMSERSFLYHVVYFLEACKLFLLTKDYGSHHVHAHFGTNSAEVVMLAKALGGPDYSFTVHGPEEFDKPLSLHLKEKIKHSKFVAAVSSFGRSQLFRWADIEHWSKIKIIHCGLDSDFLETKIVQKKTSDVPQLLCIGRLCEQKGQLLLIDGLKKAIDKGVKVKLVLAGDGEMRSVVESRIKLYDLQDYVHITGWVSSLQIRKLLEQSDAMILPSFAEGLPVAIMEALAIGTPVLTTYIAGIPELIKDGKTGLLFPAGDSDCIASSICKFTEMSDLEKYEIAMAGKEVVVERHSISSEVSKLIDLIKE